MSHLRDYNLKMGGEDVFFTASDEVDTARLRGDAHVPYSSLIDVLLRLLTTVLKEAAGSSLLEDIYGHATRGKTLSIINERAEMVTKLANTLAKSLAHKATNQLVSSLD